MRRRRLMYALGSLLAAAPAAAAPWPEAQISELLATASCQPQHVEVPQTAPESLTADIVLDGVAHRLRLSRRSLRAETFRVSVQGADGVVRAVSVPPPRTYQGAIDGEAGSRAAASLIDGRLTATVVRADGTMWHVQPLAGIVPDAPVSLHAAYRSSDARSDGWQCGAALLEGLGLPPAAGAGQPDVSGGGSSFMELALVAFDADYEYYVLNNSSVADTVNDIETVMNSVTAIYEAEVGITYAIGDVLVRTAEPDPYTTTNASALLNEFRDHWNANHGGIARQIAHLMTGKDLDGSTIGIAWVGAVCAFPGYAYGLSQSRFTGNFGHRVALTAHELGHNWNATHCDGDGDCAIMCSILGGCSGNLSVFGASATAQITAHRDSTGCTSPVYPVGPQVVGTGDFDGTGGSDVLWRDAGDGTNQVWLVLGTSVVASLPLPAVADPDWVIAGTGDFDGGGTADMLWRHLGTGQNLVWLMGTLSVVDWGFLPAVPDSGWRVDGTGDFDGDGRADILWRHQTTGQNLVWLMQGKAVVDWGFLPAVPDPGWRIVATGDFNGGGAADVLWRHQTTGQNVVWLMRGIAVADWGFLPTVSDPNWEVVGAGDFDGGGTADVLWRNEAADQNVTWLMAGTSVAGWGFLTNAP